MEKFKLPIIRQPLPQPKSLSMDDYLRFVTLHLKYTFNRRVYQQWKKLQAVNVPFSIKTKAGSDASTVGGKDGKIINCR